MINKLNKIRENSSEEGFTLIELMIVVVIIAILAAIAIPIYANQQKRAIGATLYSDVKNTSINVATELIVSNNPEKADVVQSGENQVVISGTWDNYTITGTNENANPACVIFTSTTGEITECDIKTGGTGGTGGTGTGGTGGTATSSGLFIIGSATLDEPIPDGRAYFQSEPLEYKDGGTTTYVIPDTLWGKKVKTVDVSSLEICDIEPMLTGPNSPECVNKIPATFTLKVNGTSPFGLTFTAGDVLTIVTTLK